MNPVEFSLVETKQTKSSISNSNLIQFKKLVIQKAMFLQVVYPVIFKVGLDLNVYK